LALKTSRLELIGINWVFRCVEREGGRVTLTRPWTSSAVEFRDIDDFGCEDWEWLMAGYVFPQHVFIPVR